MIEFLLSLEVIINANVSWYRQYPPVQLQLLPGRRYPRVMCPVRFKWQFFLVYPHHLFVITRWHDHNKCSILKVYSFP
jgi:hypothetical protein